MRIGHVALYTSDLEKSVAFYELLGGKKGAGCVLDMGNGTSKQLLHMEFEGETTLELVKPSDPAMMREGTGMYEHFCFSVDDVDEIFHMLKREGIDTFDADAPYELPVLGGIKIIFLTGPGGEMIELFQSLK